MIDKAGRYLPSHLSPSQFTLYRLCPVLYRERYVLNLFPPPQPERLFGIAVHAGLEAQFRGGDDEQTFLKVWREHASTIQQELFPLLPALRARGLELLQMVRELNLRGEPERWISVIAPDFIIPIIGYVDLWSDGVIYDFKTAGYGWTQTQADNQLFQPAVYSQAYSDQFGEFPEFKFVVLPRIHAPVQVLDATRSGQQITDAFAEGLRIHRAIENQEWDCTCRGRYHLFGDGYADFEDEVGV
jgi:hypothetical protein